MNSNLSKYILATVTYYDVMDYPLTVFEVWKYLTKVNKEEVPEKTYSLVEIAEILRDEKLGRFIEEQSGFYFLKGRKELVALRLERNKISEEKFRQLQRIVSIVRYLPFVRMVAATGSVAMKNAEKDSDLDLLIVLQHGRIFIGRTVVTLVLHFLGLRRYAQKVANRACLNYFITTNSLEIDLKDMFSASEYSFIVPLFGWDCFKQFQANNEWIRNYKITFEPEQLANLKMIGDTFVSRNCRRLLEKVLNLDFLEEQLKKWEVARIMRDPRTHKEGNMVLVSDAALVFLPDPQGPQVYDKFQERLETIG